MTSRDRNTKIRKQFKVYICSICGSDKTALHSKDKHPVWSINKSDGSLNCRKCFDKYFRNKQKDKENLKIYYENNKERLKEKSRQYSKKAITFKDKKIRLDYNPRKNICSECGFEGKTDLHHDKYDELNPLNHTRELCVSCHSKITWKQRKKEGVEL